MPVSRATGGSSRTTGNVSRFHNGGINTDNWKGFFIAVLLGGLGLIRSGGQIS